MNERIFSTVVSLLFALSTVSLEVLRRDVWQILVLPDERLAQRRRAATLVVRYLGASRQTLAWLRLLELLVVCCLQGKCCIESTVWWTQFTSF